MTVRCNRIFLLFFLCSGALFAQEGSIFDQKAEEHFSYAVGLFEQGQFAQCAEAFDRLLRAYPSCHRATAAYVMRAKAYLRAGDPAAAAESLKPLFIRFPKSLYLEEALLISARARARTGSFQEAALACAVACAQSHADSIRDEAARLLRAEIQPFLSESGFDSVRSRIRNREAEWVLWESRARVLYAQGDLDGAGKSLQEAEALRPAPSLSELRAAIDRESGRSAQPYKIILVRPDPGREPAAALVQEDLARGVRAAFSQTRIIGSLPIEIVPLTFNGDTKEFSSQLTYLRENPLVLAMIGGIYSQDTRQIAEVAARFPFPFLAPTATANGIAAIGDNIFQCNADFNTRGAAMAQYARTQLHARRCAILAPLDGYGKFLAEGFAEAARKKGLAVEVVSWYQSADVSLANQVFTIKKGISLPDTLDVLYAPVARHEQAVEVAQLCLQMGLRCRILGSGDWHDPDILRKLPAGVLPVDFEGDYLADEKNSAWSAFSAAYARLYKEPCTRHTFLGYDAAVALAGALRGGRLERIALLDRLRHLRGIDGLRGPIGFSTGRVSDTIPVLRFDNGRIQKITDIHTGE